MDFLLLIHPLYIIDCVAPRVILTQYWHFLIPMLKTYVVGVYWGTGSTLSYQDHMTL